jgi:nitroreductase
VEALEAILTRRSVGKVRPDAVPRETVERLLEAAVHAPNHHLNLPWRFWVLTGAAREALGEAMAAALRERTPDPDDEAGRAALERERRKPLRAPVVIVAAVEGSESEPVLDIENVAAGAAAIQNLLLAAHALGLGGMWRTGGPAYQPQVKAHFGLRSEDHLLGFLYLGYPTANPQPTRRSAEGRVTWWSDKSRDEGRAYADPPGSEHAALD